MTLFDPTLYLVIERSLLPLGDLEDFLLQAIAGGVTAVQLREKNLSGKDFFSLGQRLLPLLRARRIPLIINDRIDIALALQADGAHIGQSDLPYKEARKLLGKKAIIGLTINTWQEAQEAEALDVDYLGVSPLFSTQTKRDLGPPWGLSLLKKLRESSSHSLVAIGGVNLSNAFEAIKAGADGLAVVSAICSSLNPQEASRQIRACIKAAKEETASL